MSVQIASMFAVPVGQSRVPDAGPLNRELEALLLAREADPERYRNAQPSLKQQEGVFESNFDLFASPEPCIRRLRAFCWSIISEVSSTPVSLKSAQTTLAPSRAKTSAAARPMPEAAPVMTMVLPWK